MASPTTQPPTQPPPSAPSQTLTPPNDTTTTNPTTQPPPPPQSHVQLPSHPPTSTHDPGTTRRPRDARLIHLILASLGVSAYQERVPLQLLDFAYRYTSSVLSDAVYLQSEGYDTADGHTGGITKGKGRGGGAAAGQGGAGGAGAATGGGGAAGEKEEVSLAALRIAIGSRMQYQYQGSLPKEFLMGLARERNRVGLGVGRGTNTTQNGAVGGGAAGQIIGGVRLPPEKYCLTGVGWGIRDGWDSEGEEEQDMPMGMMQGNGVVGGGDGADDDEGEATMEDIFGDDGGGGGEDEDMRDD